METAGGYVKEYIIRVVDETGGQEEVLDAPQQPNGTAQPMAPKKKKSAKETATDTKTGIYKNAALKVALPALNAVTNGLAGQVVGTVNKVGSLLKSLATGSIGGAVGVAASAVGWVLGQAVSEIVTARAENDTLAGQLDETNFLRQCAGLDKIRYTQSGITKKVSIKEDR